MTQLHEMQHDEDEQSEQDQERMTRTGSFHQHNPWQEQHQQSTHGTNPLGSGPQHPPGGPGAPEGSVVGGLNIGGMNPQQRPSLTPQHIQMLARYASRSAADLRAQGVHERVIQFVEQNRATLQRNALDQDRFRGQGGLSSGVVKEGQRGAQNPAGSTPQHNLAPPFDGLPTRGPMPTNPASAIMTSLMRSEPQLTQTAIKIIQQLKTNIPQQLESLRSATAIVSPDQRMEYNQLVEQVFRASREVDAKLPMFYVLLNNVEMLQELVSIDYAIQTQRSLLSSNQPRFVISLENLRFMAGELGRAKEIFQVALTNLIKSQQAAAGHAQGGPRSFPSEDKGIFSDVDILADNLRAMTWSVDGEHRQMARSSVSASSVQP